MGDGWGVKGEERRRVGEGWEWGECERGSEMGVGGV